MCVDKYFDSKKIISLEDSFRSKWIYTYTLYIYQLEMHLVRPVAVL